MICEKVVYRSDVDENQKEKGNAWVFIKTIRAPRVLIVLLTAIALLTTIHKRGVFRSAIRPPIQAGAIRPSRRSIRTPTPSSKHQERAVLPSPRFSVMPTFLQNAPLATQSCKNKPSNRSPTHHISSQIDNPLFERTCLYTSVPHQWKWSIQPG